MLLIILKSLYFFLPAYFANMAPVLLRWIPILEKPVNEELFGKNKTWRGILVAIIIGSFVFSIQKILYAVGFQTLSLINYNDFSPLLGLLLGLGAILGDMIKSYYKRKHQIKAGKPWLFWDQIDFVLGGLILSLLIYVPPPEVVLIILVFSPLLHLLVNYIGYLLKIRDVKY